MSMPLWQILVQYVLVAIVVVIAIFAEFAIEAYDDDGSYSKAYLLRILVRWYRWVYGKVHGDADAR